MEYILIIIIGILFYIEINKLKKQVKSQQIQIDALCKNTGNNQLATCHISDEDKEYLISLKKQRKRSRSY